MKTSISLAIFISLASTVKSQLAGLGGNYVDPAIKLPTTPSIWLYWYDNGVEKYSLPYKLSDECRRDLIDYEGVWVGPDPRPPQSQKGCGISWSNGDCTGKAHQFELGLSEFGSSQFKFSDIDGEARSFQFIDAKC